MFIINNIDKDLKFKGILGNTYLTLCSLEIVLIVYYAFHVFII